MNFRAFTACTGLLLALCSGPATALPVSAAIDGLPPGLNVVLTTQRCVVGDFNGNQTLMQASRIALAESFFTEYETVPLPTGGFGIRAKVVTRYSGQVDVSPDPNQAGLVACDIDRPGSVVLSFSVGVQGVAADGSTQFREAALGQTFNRINPVALRRTLFGSTGVAAAPTQVPRDTPLTFELLHQNPFRNTGAPAIEFSRAVQVPGQLFATAVVTRIFVAANGRKCITAGSQTRCNGDTPLVQGMLLHGGVALDVAATRPRVVDAAGNEKSIFVFGLASTSFVAGSYTVRQLADDLDPLQYYQDGTPTPLNLLEWRPFSSTIRVL